MWNNSFPRDTLLPNRQCKEQKNACIDVIRRKNTCNALTLRRRRIRGFARSRVQISAARLPCAACRVGHQVWTCLRDEIRKHEMRESQQIQECSSPSNQIQKPFLVCTTPKHAPVCGSVEQAGGQTQHSLSGLCMVGV